MPEIIPFRGIVYNADRVRAEEVVSPPYDIVTPRMKELLYNKSPYNIIRIDFGKDEQGDTEHNNRYTRAVAYLKQWLQDGILQFTPRDAYYLYEVQYTAGGQKKTMKGIFARVRITELCEGVYPHEATHSKPKQDRLNLLRYCKANISPIFSIYNRRDISLKELFAEVQENPPYFQAPDLDGFVHRMWIIDDPQTVQRIKDLLGDTPIYIADGHHRYETALQYMKEMKGQDGSGHVMMYLVNMAEEDLTILPTHRIVKGLPEELSEVITPLRQYFEISEVEDPEDLPGMIADKRPSIGFFFKKHRKGFILTHNGAGLSDIPPVLRRLEVTILHELILKRLYNIREVTFEMDPAVALKMVTDNDFEGVFFVNPTRVEDVEAVALECLRMPPKSTYFFPKILTGFVINPLQTDPF